MAKQLIKQENITILIENVPNASLKVDGPKTDRILRRNEKKKSRIILKSFNTYFLGADSSVRQNNHSEIENLDNTFKKLKLINTYEQFTLKAGGHVSWIAWNI